MPVTQQAPDSGDCALHALNNMAHLIAIPGTFQFKFTRASLIALVQSTQKLMK
jgi:hypothetical protein